MLKDKIDAIANAYDLDTDMGKKVLIGGQLVFASTQATQMPPKDFIPQVSREAVNGLFGGLKNNTPKIHIAIDPKLFDHPKSRFAFVLDAYLSWGLRQKRGVVVILGGIERVEGAFNVDVLVFDSGRLLDVYDRELPEKSSIRFGAAAESIIAEIRAKHPTAKVVQAGPLSDWQMDGVEFIGDKALKALSYRPLSKSVSSRAEFFIPSLIGIAGLVIYSGLIGQAWNKYEDAQSAYDVAVADQTIKQHGGVDANYLSVMTQRRLFMESPRRQDVLPKTALKIVRGIGAVPSVQIVEMKLPAPSVNPQAAVGITVIAVGNENNNLITPERVPDTWMKISVPKSDESAMDQAKAVMTIIAKSTGMSLRLAHQGWQDNANRRIYTIEGFIHG